MTLLIIVIAAFVVLETTNIAALYFFPDSKLANSVGVFKAWEKSKADPEMHNFVRYLVNWVAGTKVIFIFLLVVILFTADGRAMVLTGTAMAISIAVFFWRLFPLARTMDQTGQIEPTGYSKALGWMILGMILLFGAGSLVLYVSEFPF